MIRPMNDTRRQRMLREALGPDPIVPFSVRAVPVAFAFAMLIATGFASALGTHDVPVVNGPPPAATVMADVTMLSALISDARRDD